MHNQNLFKILEEEALPLFYDKKNLWTNIMKAGMRNVMFRFDSDRMAKEYYEKLYKD